MKRYSKVFGQPLSHSSQSGLYVEPVLPGTVSERQLNEPKLSIEVIFNQPITVIVMSGDRKNEYQPVC